MSNIARQTSIHRTNHIFSPWWFQINVWIWIANVSSVRRPMPEWDCYINITSGILRSQALCILIALQTLRYQLFFSHIEVEKKKNISKTHCVCFLHFAVVAAAFALTVRNIKHFACVFIYFQFLRRRFSARLMRLLQCKYSLANAKPFRHFSHSLQNIITIGFTYNVHLFELEKKSHMTDKYRVLKCACLFLCNEEGRNK